MEDLVQEFNRICSESHGESEQISEKSERFFEVLVKGLEKSLSDDNLKTWFTKLCGGVQSAEVVKDEYGKSSGYGIVRFYKSQDAERAIRITDKREMNGRILSVQVFEGSLKQSEVTNRNVFVKGFGETLNDKELRIYFRDNVGDVESATVVKYENGVSKGYGYVSFFMYKDAVKAVQKINGRKVHGNTLIVEPFKSKEQRSQEPNRNVYVKGFEEVLDDEDLRKLFEIFGEIESAKVQRDVNGIFRGYGYVCFSRWEDAEAAISKMNGCKLGKKILTVGPFQSREEREKELKNRYLHIRNLHFSVGDRDLEELFEPYGRIRSAHVDPSPIQGKRQGRVCFETAKEADDAVAALNRFSYKGLILQVSVYQKGLQKKRRNEVSEHTPSIYVKHNNSSESAQVKSYYKNAHKNISMVNLSKKTAKSRIAANFGKSIENLSTNNIKLHNANFSQRIENLTTKNTNLQNAANHNRSGDDKKMETSASEKHSPEKQCLPKISSRYMSVPDLMEEPRGQFLSCASKPQQGSSGVCLPSHIKSTPSMTSRERVNNSPVHVTKKAYVCGRTVRKDDAHFRTT